MVFDAKGRDNVHRTESSFGGRFGEQGSKELI